jgi:hypothetical protein
MFALGSSPARVSRPWPGDSRSAFDHGTGRADRQRPLAADRDRGEPAVIRRRDGTDPRLRIPADEGGDSQHELTVPAGRRLDIRYVPVDDEGPSATSHIGF